MSYQNPLIELLRHGATITGFVAYLIGFAVFVLVWRLTRDRAYFFLGLGFALALASRSIFLLLTLIGGGRVSRRSTDDLSVVSFLLSPYVSLICSLLLIIGFAILGRRAIKTFKSPPLNSPPPLPATSGSEES